jgi:molybdate transport system substrate-binding protein
MKRADLNFNEGRTVARARQLHETEGSVAQGQREEPVNDCLPLRHLHRWAWLALQLEGAMDTFSVAVVMGLAMALAPAASAAELRVLTGGSMTAVWAELKPKFEQASGHKLDIFFGTTPNLIKEATSGKPFDLGVVPAEVMQDAVARARFAAGSTLDIARVGLGVAVRAGAPKPDIGTTEALKAALLNAASIATLPASAAGAQVMKTFDRLAISEAIKGKLRAKGAPAEIIQAVAKGEAELGVFALNVLTAPGLDIVGPFPAELQQEVVFTAAPALDSTQAEAAKALIAYLKSPEADAVLKANGMTPG